MSNPRIFVTTDIGGSDKDDDQSMVHLLLYADKLRIEGIGSAAAKTLADSTGRAADIHQVINAYANDYSKLITYSKDYPTADYLRSIVSQGAVGPAPKAGYSKPTETSQAIIAAARAGSEADPLYVLTWGSIGDVAQALHDAPDIAGKIRIHSIAHQDSNAGQYMLDNWKGKVWWIDSQTTFRGLYAPESGTNTPMAGWTTPNAKGHGALGDYFEAHSYDLYGNFDGSQSTNGLKMGDAPTVLYLLDNANNDDPTADSWGGQFVQKGTNYWTDDRASSLAFGSWYGARTVAEHRDMFLKDFSARLDRAKAAKAGPVPAPTPDPTPSPPASGRIQVGTTEIEMLSLSGFTVEKHGMASAGQWVRTTGSGTALGVFGGPNGVYKIAVSYMDENDGVSPMSLAVNGRVVKSWSASANDDKLHGQSMQVSLNTNDTIAIKGAANAGEYSRIDQLMVEAVKSSATPAPAVPPPAINPAPPIPPPPNPQASGRIQVGMTEVERLLLSGFTVEKHGKASDGHWVKTTGNGTASGMFGGADGVHRITVAYMDEGDGVSPISLTVNGRVVKSWSASANNEQVQSQSVEVSLRTGDTIALKGAADQGEYARLDWLKIEAGTGATSAAADRNLHVEGVTLNGTAVPDGKATLFSAGLAEFETSSPTAAHLVNTMMGSVDTPLTFLTDNARVEAAGQFSVNSFENRAVTLDSNSTGALDVSFADELLASMLPDSCAYPVLMADGASSTSSILNDVPFSARNGMSVPFLQQAYTDSLAFGFA